MRERVPRGRVGFGDGASPLTHGRRDGSGHNGAMDREHVNEIWKGHEAELGRMGGVTLAPPSVGDGRGGGARST